MADLIAATTAWYIGHVSGATWQTQVVDPINAFAAGVTADSVVSYIDVTQTGGPTIPNSGTTIVSGWATRSSNNPPSYSSGTWTVDTGDDGLYEITGHLSYVSSTDGNRLLDLLINGVSVHHRETIAVAVKNQLPINWSGVLVAGDTIAVRTSQTASGSTTLASGNGDCHLTIARTGPA